MLVFLSSTQPHQND
jgi:hypothetical protein